MARKNWSCSICGLSTGRNSSVKRHNDNLHDGKATIVSYEEYITGVRSGSLPPPTYVYDRMLPKLKNSSIGVSNISIAYCDLKENAWNHKFRTIFSRILSDDARSNSSSTLTPRNRGSLLAVHYFGFVCPICLSIGISGTSQAAEENSQGKHPCNLAGFESFAALAMDLKKPMIERLRGQELVNLLYGAVKATAQIRSLVLTGYSLYPNYRGYLYNPYKTRNDLLERLILNQDGNIVLTDRELIQFLWEYKKTSISVFLLDDYDIPFNYDLQLNIMGSQ